MSLDVEQVRRFQRVVTQRAGALDEEFLGRGRSLGLSRLLWEIGVEGQEVVALRARLGMDSGQLSRMLRALEDEGLVVLTQARADARVRIARLTREGLVERQLLDQLSDHHALAVLEPLDDHHRSELVTAMRTVEQLLLRSAVELRHVSPDHPDAQRCLRAYVAELNRRAPERGFDPSTGSTADPDEVTPPNGAFVVAVLHGDVVGCGAVKHHPDRGVGASDIKRMWVAESARGLGLGRRLLGHLEDIARAHGSREARLETNDVLPEAIALYLSSGYVDVARFNEEPFADRWFSKTLQ